MQPDECLRKKDHRGLCVHLPLSAVEEKRHRIQEAVLFLTGGVLGWW